jgi:hypothetical protein
MRLVDGDFAFFIMFLDIELWSRDMSAPQSDEIFVGSAVLCGANATTICVFQTPSFAVSKKL